MRVWGVKAGRKWVGADAKQGFPMPVSKSKAYFWASKADAVEAANDADADDDFDDLPDANVVPFEITTVE